MAPPFKGEKLIETIASAPESTIRSVLRALCADSETEYRIGELLARLLPDSEPSDGNSSANNNKRKPGSKMEICAQCDQPFDENDGGGTCVYHPVSGHFPISFPIYVSFRPFQPRYDKFSPL
jgi:hypothetical protein